MRKIKAGQLSTKSELKIADDILGLKDTGTNVIIQNLENSMKLREMSVEKRLKKQLLK